MTAATMTKTEALAIARQARRYGHWGDLPTTRGPCRWAAPGANSACTRGASPGRPAAARCMSRWAGRWTAPCWAT